MTLRTLIAGSMTLAAMALAGCGERTTASGERASPGVVSALAVQTTETRNGSQSGHSGSVKGGAMGSGEKGSSPSNETTREAMFGAGCFWGVEAIFAQTPGVLTTAVGYAGGKTLNPTYKQVCYEDTGHAEVVHVTYDPSKVSYSDLLLVFFSNHDATQVNRQGPDVGTQYRSVVFAYGDEQKAEAEAVKKSLNESGRFRKPIATLIEPAPTFWRAEEYHQQYLKKQGLENCHIPNN